MMKDKFLFYERKEKSRSRYGSAARKDAASGFRCTTCHAFVSTEPGLSCVQNRNHCPHCLWSRHLDLYEAGDRLSACKALMQPIGLTIKQTRKKYGSGRGELMLVHVCKECGDLSINRLAADDDPQRILAVFEMSFRLDALQRARLEVEGILVLDSADRRLIQVQLFGREVEWTGMLFPGSALETG